MKRLLLLFAVASLYASGPGTSLRKDNELPLLWLTGPLLTPSALTIPPATFNFEPYFFYNGDRSSASGPQRTRASVCNMNFQFPIQFGLNEWMDLTLSPQFYINYEGLQDAWRFGDFYSSFSFQLAEENHKTGMPAIRFIIGELFPTGQYQNFDIFKLGTDAAGGGSFVTSFKLVTSRAWHIASDHYIDLRGALFYQLCSPVTVHGISSYGGDPTTLGKVYPGNIFTTLLSMEFTFTKHWAFACDVASVLGGKSPFHGDSIAPVGSNRIYYSLSFAPAIEYNFSKRVGLIGGVWVSAYNYNTPRFLSGVLALNWTGQL